MARRRWLIPLAVVGAFLLYRRLQRDVARQAAGAAWEFSGPMARVYDLLFSSPIDSFYARIAQRLTATLTSGQVLDVGCGPGRLAVQIARQAPGLIVTGIDISPDMIELARRRAEAGNLSDRVHFQIADVRTLPFPDNQFDLVVSTLSLHHWRDPVRGLAEIHRVLKPGGQACIYDVADWFLRLTHHGVGLAHVLAESPFAGTSIEPVWPVGPVPLIRRFCLGR